MSVFKGSKYSYIVISAAAIIAFLAGTSIAWSSPVLAILSGDNLDKIPLGRPITVDEGSWIGSLSALGAAIGPFIFGYLVETIGRKKTVTLIALPFLVGYLVAAFAKTIPLFYVARLFMGVGTGAMFCILPIFTVETVEDVNRGLLQATSTSFIMLGLLFSYCVGPYVSIMTFNLILASVCVLFVPVFWYVAPETPYYLVRINEEQKAFESLRYLRRTSDDQIKRELENIKTHLRQLKPGLFVDLFKTKVTRKAFFYTVALTTFQQLSGITVILYFAQNIFDATGSDIPPEVCSIIIGSVQFLVSVISPPFLDRAGKKVLLFIAVTGAMCSEVLLGVYFYLDTEGEDVSGIDWLPVVSLVLFIGFYNFGLGSIPWAVLGDILPLNIISKAAVIATSFYWLVGFFLTQYFASLNGAIGMAGSFWLFAGFCAANDLFVFFFMFETKGKSLTEIQAILSK